MRFFLMIMEKNFKINLFLFVMFIIFTILNMIYKWERTTIMSYFAITMQGVFVISGYFAKKL